MDYETLLAFTGLYFMFIGVFAHFLKSFKKLVAIDRELLNILETNQKMLNELKAFIENSDKEIRK